MNRIGLPPPASALAAFAFAGGRSVPMPAVQVWTPTFTSVANLDSTPSLNGTAFYMDFGGFLVGFLSAQCDPTTAQVLTQFRVSPPLASAFSSAYQAWGVCAVSALGSLSTVKMCAGQVQSVAATDDLIADFIARQTAAAPVSVCFGMQVL